MAASRLRALAFAQHEIGRQFQIFNIGGSSNCMTSTNRRDIALRRGGVRHFMSHFVFTNCYGDFLIRVPSFSSCQRNTTPGRPGFLTNRKIISAGHRHAMPSAASYIGAQPYATNYRRVGRRLSEIGPRCMSIGGVVDAREISALFID